MDHTLTNFAKGVSQKGPIDLRSFYSSVITSVGNIFGLNM